MTSIKAYMQLLARKLKLDKGCAEAKYVNRVQDQVEKLNSLITDLLDLSKIDNGKLGINKKSFRLNVWFRTPLIPSCRPMIRAIWNYIGKEIFPT
ncbi:hypothetical protein KUH03_00155 [Sphingobacterium sp. E70]|uniref:histidine kinase dimerization/phospho-acceptor domain-containing protein n=1 Tax=Sphingobacterium sp. E70 TaxID=2853439 RepID=UPI00211C2549|nr:histidine kinase dimerization/phospho-acceptor domain-containing protein [Sphingobacterium sp. E70]ULT25480.1 hypothetical protein KUH03_00155 [Sphingobacterium sp. E70]